nr:IS66 family insertion sequence element accessory protein TnpB [Escherichia coli]
MLNDNPFSGHLFIFRGRRGDTVKILWADADGLYLFSQSVEGFTHIGNAGNEPDTGT